MSYLAWSVPFIAVAVGCVWRYRWVAAEHGEFAYQSDRWFFASFLSALAACLVLTVAAVLTANRISCEKTADAMGRDSRYGVFTGCLVETPSGEWVPLDSFRSTNEEAP